MEVKFMFSLSRKYVEVSDQIHATAA